MALLTRPDFRDKISPKLQDFSTASERTPYGEQRWLIEDSFLEYLVDQLLEAQHYGYLQGCKDTREKMRGK